jgi:2-polyprenyl-3-methyl-5-hydroxy-6-metoxy-1,4-benzoquinol methylase
VSDIVNIPVPESSFDAVIGTDVLEHVPVANSAINEIRHIVRNNGKILITVPIQCDAHQTNYFFEEIFKGCKVKNGIRKWIF